jgi:putative membrane protein
MDPDTSSTSMPALIRPGLTLAIILACTTKLHAHEGELLRPHDLWTAWEFPAGIVIPLILSAFLYAKGVMRSRRRSLAQIAAFAVGWITLSLSLVSPIHPLGEVLFSVHMLQHTILMLIGAPLLVLGRPLVPFLFALPLNWRKGLGKWTSAAWFVSGWRLLSGALFASMLQGAILWLWHIPALYQRTLESDLVHSVQHLSFLFSALLFWWVVIQKGYGTGIFHVFATAVHTSVLGALMALAPSVWYPLYADRTEPWGLSPIEDQQLAGLVMWVPGGVIYLGAALALLFFWIRQSDRTAALAHSSR